MIGVYYIRIFSHQCQEEIYLNCNFFVIRMGVIQIYEKIANLCKEKGTTISALERELGFGNGTIHAWRQSSPTVENVKKVAMFFCVTIDEIVNA